MIEKRAKRKLSAILSADVEGYSRLMGEDELATVRTLEAYREMLIKVIRNYSGRVVDSPGDNILAEFASVVDAVESAVEIQKELKAKNAELPENRRMKFRIGINIGDVIEEGERIYGDGVNIAARIEGLAEGGGICISSKAFQEVKNKLSLGYEYLGEHSVKNIVEPVRVYQLLMEPEVAGKIIGEERPIRWRWTAIAVALILVVVGAAVIWHFYLRTPPVEPASIERMAFPLPEKPSIAVLPFDNMSGDPELEYIADGITENIITGLSMTPEMFVIARNSTFTYKGKPVKVRQVSEELGVRYVLEGSVQKEGDRLRINAQLIDAIQGHHLWAEKYDRHLKDLFALQDEITIKVITELQVKLTEGDYARVLGKGTDNIEAYLKCLHAIHLMRRFIKEDNVKSRKMFEEVIDLDPNYPRPYIYLGWTHMLDGMFGWSKSREESLAYAENLAPKALELDDSLGMPHRLLADIYRTRRQWDDALAEAEQAVSKDANSMTMFGVALTLDKVGRHEESIAWFEKILRLDPYPPVYFLVDSGIAYFMAERYEDALAKFKLVIERAEEGEYNLKFAHRSLAATYSMLGQEEKARHHAAQLLRLDPKFSLERFANWFRPTYKNRADVDPYISALRKAGIPETPSLPLPDKPSIAVLPFVNMSDDPKQEYFSDGITNDIITDLSKVGGMFVVASNSTFTYKNKPTKVQEVSRDLGVRYVLEGGVQKAGDRVRINAQLIDATTGQHLWAERFDRSMDDIFAVQDEITEKIVAAVFVKLDSAERHRAMRIPTESAEAYELNMRAREIWHRWGKKNNDKARRLWEKAIELDPEYAHAYGGIAWTLAHDYLYYGGTGESLERALEAAQKAISLDNEDFGPRWTLGYVLLQKRLYDQAITAYHKALALHPNNADLLAEMGNVLTRVGRPQDAIEQMKKAMRLNPLSPNWYAEFLGLAYYHAGQYEEAIVALKPLLHLEWRSVSRRLAASYAQLDRLDEARAQAAELLKRDPDFSIATFSKTEAYKNPSDLEHFLDGLRKAGLK